MLKNETNIIIASLLNMRKKDYAIGKIKRAIKKKLLRFDHTAMMNMDVMLIFNIYKQFKQKKEDLKKYY